MTDLRTAAQQALEALEMLAQPTKTNSETPRYKAHKAAITALRAALAQQTQTPCDIAEDGVCEVIDCCRNSTREEQEPTVRFKCTVVDNQHPNGVPFEQWVNAPQQEAPKGGGNLPPPLQAEPVEEPVAYTGDVARRMREAEMTFHLGMPHAVVMQQMTRFHDLVCAEASLRAAAAFAIPPRREWQSLSEEEIDRWTPEIHPVIRAVEAALKEKNA
jgi:hypothetical protein